MYISYDLAKAIQRDRVSKAMSEIEARRRAVPEVPNVRNKPEADVIELVFSSHCDADRIGA